jgi:hypothetical protein
VGSFAHFSYVQTINPLAATAFNFAELVKFAIKNLA